MPRLATLDHKPAGEQNTSPLASELSHVCLQPESDTPREARRTLWDRPWIRLPRIDEADVVMRDDYVHHEPCGPSPDRCRCLVGLPAKWAGDPHVEAFWQQEEGLQMA